MIIRYSIYMDFNSVVLLSLSAGITIGAPLYIFFRERMGNQATQKSDLSRRRVLKLTTINLTLNILVGMVLMGMFLNIFTSIKSISIYEIFISLMLFVSAGATFYGNGIYITSIILEAYTLPQLQRLEEYKTQFIATHLFHGPISHVLIYSGWPIAMFFLALLETFSYRVTSSSILLLILGGSITAIAYSLGQIYNKTYFYQMITNTVLGTILFVLFLNNVNSGPVFIYSIAFTVTSCGILWMRFIQNKLFTH